MKQSELNTVLKLKLEHQWVQFHIILSLSLIQFNSLFIFLTSAIYWIDIFTEVFPGQLQLNQNQMCKLACKRILNCFFQNALPNIYYQIYFLCWRSLPLSLNTVSLPTPSFCKICCQWISTQGIPLRPPITTLAPKFPHLKSQQLYF